MQIAGFPRLRGLMDEATNFYTFPNELSKSLYSSMKHACLMCQNGMKPQVLCQYIYGWFIPLYAIPQISSDVRIKLWTIATQYKPECIQVHLYAQNLNLMYFLYVQDRIYFLCDSGFRN